MAAAIDTNVNLKDYNKCGVITTAIEVGRKVFALNCLFCATVCMQLETFALHIEEYHGNELYVDYDHSEEVIRELAEKEAEEEEEEEDQEAEDVKPNGEHDFEEKKDEEQFEQQKSENTIFDDDYFFVIQLPKKSQAEEIILRDEKADVKQLKQKLSTTKKCIDPLQHSRPKRKCRSDDKVARKQKEAFIDPTPQELEIKKEESQQSITNENDDVDDGDHDDDDYGDNEAAVDYKKAQLEENTEDSSESASESEMEFDEDDIFDDNDAANKDLLLAIIEEYEKFPLLWNASEPNAKIYKKRLEALNCICNTLKQRLSITLSPKCLMARINKIRYKYRSELGQRKQAESNGEVHKSALWYFDNLAYLSKVIEYKPRKKRNARSMSSNEKSTLPLPHLTAEQSKQLIDIYKSFPCLWDVQHVGFRFKNQRLEALQKMIEAIKSKMNLNVTQKQLQRQIYRIRYACTQEKHRTLQLERSSNELFQPTSAYYEHISFLLDHVGPFKCDFCEKVFSGADQFRIHKSEHDGSMPFVCPICNRGFMKVGNCTVHVRRHTRDYPFACKECGKRFATTTDVNVHMRYHTGEKPYFCEVCGSSFRTWSFFDAHMRRHQKRASHKCSICDKAFYENNKLTDHMKSHLNVRDKVCNICGKAFTSAKYLRQHKQIHSEKKQYMCKICSKEFAQYAGLSCHMKSHGTTVSGGAVNEDNH